MIYIVPSRGRPHVMHDLIDSWERTRTVSRLHIIVDEDDETKHDYRKFLKDAPAWVRWTLVPTNGMNEALNYAARIDAESEDIVGFMGDDHRPRSVGWDGYVAEAWRNGGRVIYGNDLIQGPNLPTQVALDARIIQRIGYMAPPALKHLYLDNFWKTLGDRLETLTYLPYVIIEHVHPIAGKTEWDEGYRRVNDGALYADDGATFWAYMESTFEDDVKKIGDLSGV
jgi:hypothetical protein